MRQIDVWDHPDEGYAFNLFLCECGIICKEDVWNNAGQIWINIYGGITRKNNKSGN